MNYTEIEAKVREATNDEAWGPTGALMLELAHATFTYEHFPEVMSMLWKRMLQDSKQHWRRTYKVVQLKHFNNRLINIIILGFTCFKLFGKKWIRKSSYIIQGTYL